MGLPVWATKQIVPSSEFPLWKAKFDQQWVDNTVQSYEFALLRQCVLGAFGGTPPDIDKMLLSNMLKEAPKPWDDQNDEEREQFIKEAKAEARALRGK